MLLDIFTNIKKITANWRPHNGIRIVPVASVPTEAPQRSAARQPAAGLRFSPIIPAAMGNWNPQRKENKKPYSKKHKGGSSLLK